MKVPSFTLAARTLREDARSTRLLLLRMALLLVFGFVLMLAADQSAVLGAVGLRVLEWVITIDFWLVTALGITTFSAVIAEEREQRTLGLLLLAGFGPLSILLGKSLGVLCSTLLLLSVQLPFAALSITLGGVSLHQLLAAYVILAAWALGLYGIALLASVGCRSAAAAARAMLAVVLATLLLPHVVQGLARAAGADALADAAMSWADTTPWTALRRVTTTGYDAPLLAPAVLLPLLLAAAGASAAWLTFARSATAEIVASAGRGRARRPRPRPWPGARAVQWKDFHWLTGGARGMAVRCLLYVLLTAVVAGVAGPATSGALAEALVPWLLLGLLLEAWVGASRMFGNELRQRTLDSLWLLPFAARGWIRAKVMALLRSLLPGLALLLCTLVMLGTSAPSGRPPSVQQILIISAFLLANLLLGCWYAALFSLLVPRAALPLTLLCSYLTSLVVQMLAFVLVFSGGVEIETFAAVQVAGAAIVVAVLHQVVKRLLRRAAAR